MLLRRLYIRPRLKQVGGTITTLMPVKSRNWVFTINNWTQEEYAALQQWSSGTQCKYIVIGKEQGAGAQRPEEVLARPNEEAEGTRHLQGYVELTGARTRKWLSKQSGFTRAYLEARRGSGAEARSYCQKDGDFWEAGTAKGVPSERVDLNTIKDDIDKGKDELYIASTYFSRWCQYRRSFQEYIRLRNGARRKWKSWTNVIWGGTGLGKTRFVYQQHPDDDIWVYPGSGWFDGYEGQPIALFDDYRGDLDISTMLQVLDRYPMAVPIKGGHVNWNPRRIYITSNIMPTMWYESIDGETRAALLRRLDRIDVVNESIF